MKRILGALVMGAIVLGSPAVFAQDGEGGEERSKFYDFDDMLIDGQFKKPDIMREKAREKASFGRLSKLKKGFLNKVIKTSEEQALQ